MIRRFVVVMMAALSAAVAADIRVVEEIAAKVNGDIVTRGELDEERRGLEMYLTQERHLKGIELTEAEAAQSRNFLRDKIDQLLMVQKAKDLNISVESEVSKRLAEMQVMTKITDTDRFHDYIRDNTGVPFEEYKQKMTEDSLRRRLVGQEIGSRINIPEPELRKYYDAHKEQYVRKAQVFLSQILISTEGKTPEQAAAAEAKAKEVAERARKGEKFTDLVSAFSDDKETASAGAICRRAKREMSLPPIEAFAFKEKKGSVSDPIKIATGFAIMRIDERYEAGQASFDEVKEQIQETMVQPQIETKIRAYLTRLRLDAFLEIKEGYVDSGAAPGKDTHWHDIAQLKPQTITKEQVAAAHRRHKNFLFIPLPGPRPRRAPSRNRYLAIGRAQSESGGRCRRAGNSRRSRHSRRRAGQTMKSPYVNELKSGKVVAGSFLVESKEIRQKKTGELYLSLILGDRTGELDAKMWDNVADVIDTFERDDFVAVKGLVQVYHNRPQLTIHKIQRMDDGEAEFGDYFPSSKRDSGEMWLELRGIVNGIANPHLRALLDAMLNDEDIGRRYRLAPAAKQIHHAFLGGLIEHVLSVCALARVTAAHYHADLDLLLTGVLLHDIGKIYELNYERGFSYSPDGQLIGHINIAVRMVADKLRGLPDFPPTLRTLVEHMVLSHHGHLEFGSPKLPQFPEALLLHYLDDLDSKMEAMRALIENDRQVEGCFTAYNAALERSR